jgi:luciferase family oxidoreductase group 1
LTAAAILVKRRPVALPSRPARLASAVFAPTLGRGAPRKGLMMSSMEQPARSLRIGVLDQSPVPEGSTGAQALHQTLDLAKLADRLGYHRYWVAEHHGSPMLASAAPEVLIGPIAAATKRIKVGSGGIMLPHYSPLKVAETFSMLAALHPGRIDLGLGRAAGTDGLTALALQRDRRERSPDDFPQQLVELLAYLDDRMPADHPFARLSALPGRPEKPEAWLLGSSAQSGIWAAELGLPYVFADFIQATGAGIAARYRETFVPSDTLAAPKVIVAVTAICAETDEAARRLSASYRMAITLLHRGQLMAVPPVEKALGFLADEGIGLDALPPGRRAVIGSPATVRRGIEAAASAYGADEVLVVSIMHEHAARRRSYELIAQAFELEGAGGARKAGSLSVG